MAGARSRRKKYRENGAFDLLEEAFHALRVSPTSNLAVYYLGAVPFVVSLFYFWADMSRSSFALQDAGLASLLVGVAYFWMKICQTVFCRRMWVQLNAGGETFEKSGGRSLRYLAAQVLIQSTAIPALALALICLMPLAWVYAFYQNVSALGLTQDYRNKPLRNLVADAARQSHWAWGVNHLLLAIITVFSLFVWMSVMMAATYLPMLAKMLLGVESVFTLNPLATLMNSTFIFGTLLIVFLCVSPLTKTLYVIRCFYGQSRTTGADLLSRLAALKAGEDQQGAESRLRGGRLGKVALFMLLMSFAASGMARDDEKKAGAAVLQTGDKASEAEFDSAVQETLQEKHFQWRLSREQMEEAEADGARGFVRDLLQSLVAAVKDSFEAIEKVMERLFGGGKERKDVGDLKGFGGIGKMASIVMVVLLVILIAVVIKIIISRRKQVGTQQGSVEVLGPIDLESEAVLASQLPEDEWMRMAREKIEKGEYRLAVRALFLASLAHLGEHGLLKVARFKSNRDYCGELSLKARSMPTVIEAFGENVGLFEWVWYGLHDIGDEAVERFTENYEKITRMTSQSGKEEHAS